MLTHKLEEITVGTENSIYINIYIIFHLPFLPSTLLYTVLALFQIQSFQDYLVLGNELVFSSLGLIISTALSIP